MDRGQSRLGGAGAIGFTPNKFSRPPIVTCSIVRGSNHVYEAWVNDKLNWIAVADGVLQ